MATIRNLVVRISVSERTDKGIRRVTTSLRETNREIDRADKGSGRFTGTLSRLGRTSLGGLSKSLSRVASLTKPVIIGLTGVAAAAASLNTAAAAVTALAPLAGLLAGLPAAALAGAMALGTLKLATSGLDKAFKAIAEGDGKKFKESLKELPPAVRSVLTEAMKLRPVLLSIRATAQEAVFRPLQGQLTALAKVLAGPVRTGVAQVGREFGLAGRSVALFARQGATVHLLRNTFAAVAVSLRILQPALQPVLAGFRALAGVGLSFLPQIAQSVSVVAQRFGAWLQQMVASGRAAEWISNALATLKQLGGVLVNVGGILKSVLSAASAAGSNFLGVIGNALARLNAFLKTAQGQQALTSIFRTLATVGQTLGPVIAAVVTQLGGLAAPIGRLAQLVGPILITAINALGPALQQLEPGIAALLTGLGQAFAALGPALVPLARAISSVAVALAPILPLAGQLAALLAQQLAFSLTALVQVLGPVISVLVSSLAPVLPQLSQSFAQMAAAIAPVAAMVGQQLAAALRQILPQILALVPQLLRGLVPAFIQLLQAVTPLLPQLIQLSFAFLQAILPALPALLPPLIQLVTLIAQLTAAVAPAIGFLLQLATALTTVFGKALGATVRLVSDAVMAMFKPFKWLFDVLVGHSIIPDLVRGMIRWFGYLPALVAGIFSRLVSGAVSRLGGLVSAARQVPGIIRGLFSGAGGWLYNAGKAIIYGLWNGIVSVLNWFRRQLSYVTRLIPSWKGPMDVDRKLLVPSGQAIMQGLAAGITGGLPMLRSTLGRVTDAIALPGGAAPAAPGAAAVAAPRGVAASAGTGGGAVTLEVRSSGRAVDDFLAELIRRYVRVQGGGDVQVAFGRGSA
jgi:phage-related protein